MHKARTQCLCHSSVHFARVTELKTILENALSLEIAEPIPTTRQVLLENENSTAPTGTGT